MKIGILGSGDVGRSLGRGFSKHGHQVMIGSREPNGEKLAAWKSETGGNTGTFEETAAFGEIIVLATLWSGTEHAIELANKKNLAGKTLIDATNPLVFEAGKPPALAIGHTDSAGEQVQRWVPEAKVVKCFNIVGNADMVDPDFPDGPPTMFFCGNDAEAKKQVEQILKEFGWDYCDIGGIDGARLLEPMCILWVKYGFITGGWRHAFKMLKKQ